MTNKELFPPSRALLASVEKICRITNPYSPSVEIDSLFVQAMKEVVRWHQEKSLFYRQFLKDSNFDINKWDGDLVKIPSIPAEFFKYHAIKSVSDENVFISLTSSGTSGQKSQMFFDEWSLGCAQQMVDFIYDYYGWITPSEKTNYLLYTYQTESDSKLGTAFTDNFLTKYAPVNHAEFTLKLTGKGGHDFDVFGAIKTLHEYETQGFPVRIFGFPSFFYFTLQRMKELKYKPLKLSPRVSGFPRWWMERLRQSRN